MKLVSVSRFANKNNIQKILKEKIMALLYQAELGNKF